MTDYKRGYAAAMRQHADEIRVGRLEIKRRLKARRDRHIAACLDTFSYTARWVVRAVRRRLKAHNNMPIIVQQTAYGPQLDMIGDVGDKYPGITVGRIWLDLNKGRLAREDSEVVIK